MNCCEELVILMAPLVRSAGVVSPGSEQRRVERR